MSECLQAEKLNPADPLATCLSQKIRPIYWFHKCPLQLTNIYVKRNTKLFSLYLYRKERCLHIHQLWTITNWIHIACVNTGSKRMPTEFYINFLFLFYSIFDDGFTVAMPAQNYSIWPFCLSNQIDLLCFEINSNKLACEKN